MKKVAVCISGHMRSFKDGYACLERFLISKNPKFKFYFFIDTWNRIDWRTDGKFNLTKNFLNEICEIYDPVYINIEDEKEWDTSRFMRYVDDITCLKKGYGGIRSKGEHIPSMYYKINSCNQAKIKYEKDNNIIFDAVIRHRCDFSLSMPVYIEEILERFNDTIFVPRLDNPPKYSCTSKGYLKDMFAISSSENIDYYSSVYRDLDKICEQIKEFRPEPILYRHLENNDKIQYCEIEYSWDIIE